jgi:ribonuclease BN (tRNA processing enzyme)
MKLIFLGTGGYHPNERRHTASLMLPELGVVLDAGTSLFRVQKRLATPEIDILLTHAHLDHVVGLTYLLVPLLQGELKKCRVHALPEKIAAIQEHLFSQPLFPVLPPFEFIPLSDRISVAGGRGTITHRKLNHPGGSIGFRIEFENQSIAYVTDTTVDGTYTDFIRNVDLLVHECYFPDEMAEWAAKTGHSHTSQVTTLAKDAQVKKLYLTHIDPQRSDDDPIDIAKARSIFPETYLAEDLMQVDC